MAANEFEKNVKQIIAEFKLHPSDEVWQAVKKRIAEKKRKRRMIFFILFSFIGLAIGTYGVLNYLNKQNINSNIKQLKNAVTSQQEKNKKNEVSANKNQIKSGTIEKENSSNEIVKNKLSSNKKEEEKRSLHENAVKNKIKESGEKNNFVPIKSRSNIREETQDGNINKAMAIRNTDSLREISGKDITLNNEPDSTGFENQIQKEQTHTEGISNIPDTSLKEKQENNAQPGAVQSKNIKVKQQSTYKDWRWGLNFSAGSSTIAQGIFSINNDKSYNNTSYNNPGASPGNGQRFYLPSASKSSFSFKAGIILKKDLTKRSSISIGFNYTYLADKIKTGIKTDSILFLNNLYGASYFYAGTQQKTYTDHFHFIELPVVYNWRITGNTNHFLSLNAGASVAYLISAKALVYDTSLGGIYYYNKNLFTKTHFNVISGLSYHLSGTKNIEWSIGPELSFDVSKAFKSDLDKRKYFLYMGIDASVYFKKKKKK
jgi:Outer membrane protein beta-barrel domain